jgi:hypothetical protein
LDTLTEVTWNENWGERGWSWRAPEPVTAQLTCFSPETTEGKWLLEDSIGQKIVLSEGITMEKGWQQFEVPLKASGSSRYPGIGTYQLIWSSQGTEMKTKLIVQKESEETE